jgi:hypothetical protein
MREESNPGKSAAVKLMQPEKLSSDEWLEHGFARVERWLEPADRADYLIRRSIFRRVKWAVSTRPSSAGGFLGGEVGGRCAGASRR